MKRLATVIAVVGLLVLSSSAFANSTCQQYSSEVCSAHNVASQQNARTTGAVTTSAGTLPFTGLDVALLAAGGATLLGVGLVVRHFSRGLDH